MSLIRADARQIPLADESVQCCVLSPPYWGLRDYGVKGQIGLEPTPEEYVATMVSVFMEVKRVLRRDGTCWINLGDSYCSAGGLHDGRDDNQPGVGASRAWRNGSGRADGIVDERGQRNRNGNAAPGLKPKDLVGIPWRVAFALQADGWWMRSDIVWAKPNPMPESVTDRPTKSHEYVFLLSKRERYLYNADAIADPAVCAGGYAGYAGYAARAEAMGRSPSGNEKPGMTATNGATRNARSVWTMATAPYRGAHFATFPPELPERCILAGSRVGDVVLDPFVGSGTTVMVARRHGRYGVGLDISATYLHDIALARGDGRTPENAISSLPMFAGES